MTAAACMGGSTEPARMGQEHAEKCRACGTMVRHDLTEHPFFGFAAGCSRMPECTCNVQDMQFGRCCKSKPNANWADAHSAKESALNPTTNDATGIAADQTAVIRTKK